MLVIDYWRSLFVTLASDAAGLVTRGTAVSIAGPLVWKTKWVVQKEIPPTDHVRGPLPGAGNSGRE